MAILMGANSRTYKFALGHALLSLATDGRDAVTLRELGQPYALAMAGHAQHYPQAPKASTLGEADYLRVLAEESEGSLMAGEPTDRLLDATIRSIPGMVMVKFHNLKGEDGVPHRFYNLQGRGPEAIVRFTPQLLEVAADAQSPLLVEELGNRWALVESAFDSQIGRGLITGGVVISEDGEVVLERTRRGPVARSRGALIGFQHGRCFYCQAPIEDLSMGVHVDHVYPFALMTTGAWSGPDLNGVWNLVVSCAPCNRSKSARLPTEAEVSRLILRNEAILASPHPLRRSIQLALRTLGTSPYARVDLAARYDNT